MGLEKDRSLLEFDTMQEGVEFLSDIVDILSELPEIAGLDEVIRKMNVGDTFSKAYEFDSSMGKRKVNLEVSLYDDQLDICIDSDNEICDALDKRWWDKYPEE